ncbi:MAG: hypothetical protein AAF529_04235 [Pseudomonadota bacterium]
MRQIHNWLIAVCLITLSGGCAAASIKDGDYTAASKNTRVAVALLNNQLSEAKFAQALSDIGFTQSDANSIAAKRAMICPSSPEPTAEDAVSSVVLPLLTTFGKFVFDRIQDRKIAKLNALKKAAQKSYSDRLFVNSAELAGANCLALVRTGAKGSAEFSLGLIAGLRHVYAGVGGMNAFYIQPSWVRAIDSVARTSRPKKDGKAKINLSVAVALQSVGLSRDSGTPVLAAVGSSAASVPNVEMEGQAKCDNKPCAKSDLVPHLTEGSVGSLAVSVVESGQIPIDFDARIAEITAIKEAFGPAIKDALAEKFGDDG